MILVIVNESIFIILLGLYIYYAGVTSFQALYGVPLTAHILIIVLSLFINSYVSSGRIPFDIAEAEPELASGLMIEFSGPVLGFFLLMFHIKRFFVKLLPTIILLSMLIKDPIIVLVGSIVVVVLVWVLYSVIASILGRSRVDLAPITLLKVYIILIALSIIGYVLRV